MIVICAMSLARCKNFIGERIVHDAERDVSIYIMRQRYGTQIVSVNQVRSSVDRIQDPAVVAQAAPVLFGKKRGFWIQLVQMLLQKTAYRQVDVRDKIRFALLPDLQTAFGVNNLLCLKHKAFRL